MTERSEYYHFYNGEKAALPFSSAEYEARLNGLRCRDAPAWGFGHAAYLDASHRLLLRVFILCLWPPLWIGCDCR